MIGDGGINVYTTLYNPDTGPAPVSVPMGKGHPAVALHVRADTADDRLGLEVHASWPMLENPRDLPSLLRELARVLEEADDVVTITKQDLQEGE